MPYREPSIDRDLARHIDRLGDDGESRVWCDYCQTTDHNEGHPTKCAGWER